MPRPPTLRQLLQHEEYRAYFKKVPAITPFIPLNHPWQVWALKQKDGEHNCWKSRLVDSYRDAYTLVRQLYQRPDTYLDICVVSRVTLHPFPDSLCGLWAPVRFSWCCRCRRPTTFRYMPEGHRALKNAPVVTEDEPFRCYFCGIRRLLGGEDLR